MVFIISHNLAIPESAWDLKMYGFSSMVAVETPARQSLSK
jgi:hypothetical protein